MKQLLLAGFLVFAAVFSVLPKGVAAQEEYKEVVPSDGLDFTFESRAQEYSSIGGKMTVKGGRVSVFTLNGKDIKLNTKDISEDGFVDTADYGKVKVTFNSSLRASIWLTPSQRQKMKASLGK